MPGLWRKKSPPVAGPEGNPISRLVAEIRPDRVVQTGFPTSLVDLVVQHRSRRRKKATPARISTEARNVSDGEIDSIVEVEDDVKGNKRKGKKERKSRKISALLPKFRGKTKGSSFDPNAGEMFAAGSSFHSEMDSSDEFASNSNSNSVLGSEIAAESNSTEEKRKEDNPKTNQEVTLFPAPGSEESALDSESLEKVETAALSCEGFRYSFELTVLLILLLLVIWRKKLVYGISLAVFGSLLLNLFLMLCRLARCKSSVSEMTSSGAARSSGELSGLVDQREDAQQKNDNLAAGTSGNRKQRKASSRNPLRTTFLPLLVTINIVLLGLLAGKTSATALVVLYICCSRPI